MHIEELVDSYFQVKSIKWDDNRKVLTFNVATSDDEKSKLVAKGVLRKAYEVPLMRRSITILGASEFTFTPPEAPVENLIINNVRNDQEHVVLSMGYGALLSITGRNVEVKLARTGEIVGKEQRKEFLGIQLQSDRDVVIE